MGEYRSEVRDGMRIDWDVPGPDAGRHGAEGRRVPARGRGPVPGDHDARPVRQGPGLPVRFAGMWKPLSAKYPDAVAGSSNRYQNWETADPEKWVPDGYACVRVDSRGAGRSPGRLDIFSAQETRDYYDCIEWAGTQEWSNGKVGLLGISYYAVNQWQVAALRPPHLAAICPLEGRATTTASSPTTAASSTPSSRSGTRSRSRPSSTAGAARRDNPTTGEPIAGGEPATDGELAASRTDGPARPARAPVRRRVLPRAHGTTGRHHRAAAVGRQLGARPAHARQLRRLRRRLIGAEVARGARPGALRGVLHRLRRALRSVSSGTSSRARTPGGTSSRRCT